MMAMKKMPNSDARNAYETEWQQQWKLERSYAKYLRDAAAFEVRLLEKAAAYAVAVHSAQIVWLAPQTVADLVAAANKATADAAAAVKKVQSIEGKETRI